MKRVAIVGLGLMGGSLGLALKARGNSASIAGYTRSAERRAAALQRGAVDEVFATPAEAARGADLAVFCAPILAIPGLVQETLPALMPGAVITDVGSTKEVLISGIERTAQRAGIEFVGSHPIAGSEKQSIDAARADLYEGATVVVTPTGNSDPQAVSCVEALWRGVGGVVMRLAPADHDRFMARTSHLPHLAAALLAATVGRERPDRIAPLCGSGFRDTTRVAEGSPDIWRDILVTNSAAIREELRALGMELENLSRLLDASDIEGVARFLERSRAARRSLIKRTDPGQEGKPT
jgi:prephenate dehydrogenase